VVLGDRRRYSTQDGLLFGPSWRSTVNREPWWSFIWRSFTPSQEKGGSRRTTSPSLRYDAPHSKADLLGKPLLHSLQIDHHRFPAVGRLRILQNTHGSEVCFRAALGRSHAPIRSNEKVATSPGTGDGRFG
jgi:hypothetical protein